MNSLNNLVSPPILNAMIGQDCHPSQPSRNRLSLKRKQYVENVIDVKENIQKITPLKKRSLSLKRSNGVSTKEMAQIPNIPRALEDTENIHGRPLLKEQVNSPNEDLPIPNYVSSTSNINALEKKSELENELNNKPIPKTDINSNTVHTPEVNQNLTTPNDDCSMQISDDCIVLNDKVSLISVSSATELGRDSDVDNSLDTIIYEKPTFSLSFALTNCKDFKMTTKNSSIRKILVSRVQNDTNIDCDLRGHSQGSNENSQEPDVNSQELAVNSQELNVNSQELAVHSQDLNVNSQEPDVNSQESAVSLQEPDVNSQEPDIKSQEPDVNSQDLEFNGHEPDVILQEPDNNKLTPNPPKEQVVSINLEIKKNRLSTSEDQSKVLILKTNAIEKLSHVIVQPPSYKLFRRKIQGPSKISSGKKSKSTVRSSKKNGKVSEGGAKLNQIRIDALFKKTKDLNGTTVFKEKKNSDLCDGVRNCENEVLGHDDMSRIARADTARSDGVGRLARRVSKEENVLSRTSKMSPMSQIRASNSEAPGLPSPRGKNESSSSCSPRRRNMDSLQFNLPSKTKSSKTAVVPTDIPHYKIVAGTHFAVDAFCYGDIPGVKNYFLTHFHSDHYSGLKKNFNKTLFCTQITADLCTSRLGVNLKHIHVINIDETVKVDGVGVTAIDANHCPGAVMLLFSLPNGKTLLHTGDFRATPAMESHPAFWNSDIHTIYLDTTYCNPRYDFPTQDQSLEMALHILRQKKIALEKVGKKFTSVLIVCGTYTIGKEKFFLGLAKRVGCAVWACPEKDKVLQTVEKRSFSHASPQSCQLHVVPMRDLTHEKLRSYLDSLQGPFSEVVAFKPSGWENGKSAPTTKDLITVHGIPYSEHSSFSEMIRFVNFLKPKQVIPTVDISGGVNAVQKYFACPLVYKEDLHCQTKLTDFFNIQNRQQISAVS